MVEAVKKPSPALRERVPEREARRRVRVYGRASPSPGLGRRLGHPLPRCGRGAIDGICRMSVAALTLILMLAGCAQRDAHSDEERQGGLYGGVSGGLTR
jgi:hypothetical protein